MFEEFGFETLTAAQASLYFALGLGLLFGVFSEQVKFCFRRALIGADRAQAAGVWAMALLVAVLGTQYFVTTEVIGFERSPFHGRFPGCPNCAGRSCLWRGHGIDARMCRTSDRFGRNWNLRAVTALLIFAVLRMPR